MHLFPLSYTIIIEFNAGVFRLMKKEYVISLIFIICAAVVSSSTLVIVLNFPYLAQSARQLQATAGQVQNPTAAASEQEPQSLKTAAVYTHPSPSPDSNSIKKQPTLDLVLVTPGERQQIEAMLKSLGMQDGGKSEDFIREFQAKNALDQTGYIDTDTLNEIIRQLALNRASAEVQAS